jgi:hypothetical protein
MYTTSSALPGVGIKAAMLKLTLGRELP